MTDTYTEEDADPPRSGGIDASGCGWCCAFCVWVVLSLLLTRWFFTFARTPDDGASK